MSIFVSGEGGGEVGGSRWRSLVTNREMSLDGRRDQGTGEALGGRSRLDSLWHGWLSYNPEQAVCGSFVQEENS